ncbi:MAG: deoxyribodipyrimidine photo-lyase [Nevskia sp.]|nr:deoxyribodipyrimidine photo-lyase [Nevskia sp.]
MSTAIVWFRRDLRLADNPALHHALKHHAQVLPVYVHAPDEDAPWSPGGAARWWLHHSLAALQLQLRRAGAPLILRRGPSLQALRDLAGAVDAGAVYWNRLYEPAALARDRQVEQALREAGLEVEHFGSALLVEPGQLRTRAGAPFRVFTPFWRAAATLLPAREPLPEPARLAATPRPPAGLDLKALDLLPRIRWDHGIQQAWQPGAEGAAALLHRYCAEAAGRYGEQRDLPGVDGTSRLSPHLHFGEISPLQIMQRLRRLSDEEPRAGLLPHVEHYLRELGWREFAHHLLHHYPDTPQQPLDAKFARFPWRKPRDYAADLRAWQRGRTGVPIVDAGMRQLWRSGWMHNRVRMLVASFLTKNLLIPWQEGAAWFWDTLVDADLANNTLGWQWSAGCGADAAPYFRIFNPLLQGARFDPHGDYVRRWVEELAQVPDAALHVSSNGAVADGYCAPLVDLAASRRRALAAWGDIG